MKENKGSIKKIWPQGLFRFDGLSKWRNSEAQMKAIQSANLSLCNNSSRASRLAVALLAFFTIGSLFAQGAPGTIQGRILDSGTGDPMIGVTAFIREANVFGVTDIDGNYVIPDVPPGQHTVIFQMAGYETSQEVINMAAGGFEELNITMSYKTAKEVVVKAKRVNNTTAALLNKRKKAAAAQDAISSEQISKSPDSDAGDAAKRVTGVTIVGDKIFVRGLSERYTSVVLNGNAVPSTDPDNRFVPLDIFPVGIIDNLVISKSYTADKPAEFGGGALEIAIKQFPEEETLKVSIGSGYHDLTTFQNFRTYSGGSLDFLGIDDGFRSLPSGLRTFTDSADSINPNTLRLGLYTTEEVENVSKSFNKYFNPTQGSGMLPFSLGVDYGNTYKTANNNKFGFMVSSKFSEASENKTSYKSNPLSDGTPLYEYSEDASNYKTSKVGFLSMGFTGKESKYSLTSFISSKSSNKVSRQTGSRDNSGDPFTYIQTNFQFAVDTILFNQLKTKHMFQNFFVSEINTQLAFSRAHRSSPDQRSSRSRGAAFTSAIDQRHRWQENYDNSYDAKLDMNIPFKQWQGLLAKFRLGGGLNLRDRFSKQRWFRWTGDFPQNADLTDLETLVTDSAIDVANGVYLEEMTRDYDMYNGKLNIFHGFTEIDTPIIDRLRGVFGARYERAIFQMIAFDPAVNLERDLGIRPLQENRFLPTANFIYGLTEKSNLRLSYSRTISRPDFREVSPLQYLIFSTDQSAVGNLNLKETLIDNFDFRWELFPSSNEIIAMSIFYKYLDDPIEKVEQLGASSRVTWANATSALNYGIELESRVGIDQLSTEDFAVSSITNFTYLVSDINLNDGVNITGSTAEYSSQSRRLQGQAPYMINLGLEANWSKLGISQSILYNHTGPKITLIGLKTGADAFGDVIQEDFGKLDYVFKWNINEQSSLKLAASNLLDPTVKSTQDITNTDTGQVISVERSRERLGRNFSISYGQEF